MLHNLIKSQFPQFVQSEYPTLIAFIKAYYKWMEIQFSQKLETVVDVDATTSTIRLQKLTSGQPVNVVDFVQEIIVGRTSGARAIVKRGLVGTNDITLFINYITVDAQFVNDELIYVQQDDQTSVSEYEARLNLLNATGKVSSDFVDYFKSYLDVNGIFASADPYPSLFLKTIKQIYTSKGSEKALVFILEAIHNANVGILYPSDNVLRASDGEWYQECFITVSGFYGTLPLNPTEMFIKHDNGFRQVPLIRIQVIDSSTTRLFYNIKHVVRVTENQIIQLRGTDGLVVFQGRVILSPSGIEIQSSGRNWRVGQLIIIPGSVVNTIARVTQVDANGSILNTDLIECGYIHPVDQTIVISPYDFSPSGRNSSLITELISVNPAIYKHILTIRDYTEGISENIRFSAAGYFEDLTPNSLEYNVFSIENPYNLNVMFTQVLIPEPAPIPTDPDDLFISRATIVFKYGTNTKLAGRWADNNKGQISNPQIVIEDNFYYQQFSYVIDSPINPKKYIDLATAVHPAGMQMFTRNNLQTVLAVTPTAFSTILYKQQEFLDILRPTDQLIPVNSARRTFNHTAAAQDQISNRMSLAPVLLNVTVTESPSVTFSSRINDNFTVTETPAKSVSTTATDSTGTTTDTPNRSWSATRAVPDSASVTDTRTIVRNGITVVSGAG